MESFGNVKRLDAYVLQTAENKVRQRAISEWPQVGKGKEYYNS